LLIKIEKLKPISVLSRVCPAIIFANRRIDKLKSRAIYEINSIRINKKVIERGVPEGKNISKNFRKPVRYIPKIFIQIKIINE
jgi:hypothetical protein